MKIKRKGAKAQRTQRLFEHKVNSVHFVYKSSLRSLRLCVFAFNLTLASCTVGPSYVPVEYEVPKEWHSPMPESCCGLDENCCSEWWKALNDTILDSLIDRAYEQNLDLRIAGLRVLEAREMRKGKSAEKLPHIDGTASTGGYYWSKDVLGHAILQDSVSSEDIKRHFNFFEIGFDASWELDLFGRIKHEVAAMDARIEASEEMLCGAWISLTAEIARNYIELRGHQEHLKIIDKNIEAQQETVELTQDLNQAGFADDISLLETKQLLSQFKAQRPLVQMAIDKNIFALSILLASPPAELYCELIVSAPMPKLPENMPCSYPSELLRRRSDIRKAEFELAAATEMVGSAVASLFPRISLFGFVGDISTQFSTLGNSPSNTWIAGPLLQLPIFNSKLINQSIHINEIRAEQALYDYQKTILKSLEEAESAIAALQYEKERHVHLLKAFEADKEAYDLSLELYKSGIKDYQHSLIIKRMLFTTEVDLMNSNVDLLLHYISLYKALGG